MKKCVMLILCLFLLRMLSYSQDIQMFDLSNSPLNPEIISSLAIDSSNHIWVGYTNGAYFKDGSDWIFRGRDFFNVHDTVRFSTRDIVISNNNTVWMIASPSDYWGRSLIISYDGFSIEFDEINYRRVMVATSAIIDAKDRLWLILTNYWPHQPYFDDVGVYEEGEFRNLEDPSLTWVSSLAYRNDSLFVGDFGGSIYSNGEWKAWYNEEEWHDADYPRLMTNLNDEIYLFSHHSYRFNGTTFEPYSEAIDSLLVSKSTRITSAVAENDSVFWFGTLHGDLVKFIKDSLSIEVNIPEFPIRDLSFDKNGNLWFIAERTGVIVFNESKIVKVNNERPNVTKDLHLSQNYPNPFNPTTTIKFRIAADTSPLTKGRIQGGVTTLIVYDILGRKVKILVDKEMLPGKYEVEFDASGLPAGVYFYRLTSGKYSQTKKLVLLK